MGHVQPSPSPRGWHGLELLFPMLIIGQAYSYAAQHSGKGSHWGSNWHGVSGWHCCGSRFLLRGISEIIMKLFMD